MNISPKPADFIAILKRFAGTSTARQSPDHTLKNICDIPGVAFTINDFSSASYLYVSQGNKDVIGYPVRDIKNEGLNLTFGISHPDERHQLIELQKDILAFCVKIPPEERYKYKFCNDFRIKKPDGRYIWLMHEMKFLNSDNKHFPLHAVSIVSDISAYKNDPNLSLKIVKHDNSTVSVELSKKYFLAAEEKLTIREIEIIKMLSNGLTSKHISDKLKISIYTVNTHRQNILRKTNSNNLGDLMKYVFNNGII